MLSRQIRMSFKSIFVGIVALFLADSTVDIMPSARANDSEAAFAGGGLVLVNSTGISMEREHLIISRERIEVRYVFRNITDKPIETRVAFPIPRYDPLWGEAYRDDELNDPEVAAQYQNDAFQDPFEFKTFVDGSPVTAQTEVTQKGRWRQVTYHWPQTFPPGKLVNVVHRYAPRLGQGIALHRPGLQKIPKPETSKTGRGLDRLNVDAIVTEAATRKHDKVAVERDAKMLAERFCVGPRLAARMHRVGAVWENLAYVLKTGANWKGPIKQFRVTLKKDHPADRISLCYPGPFRRTSKKTFVFERENFTPTQDLDILFAEHGNWR